MKRKIDKSKLEACKLVWKKRIAAEKGHGIFRSAQRPDQFGRESIGKNAQKKLCKAV